MQGLGFRVEGFRFKVASGLAEDLKLRIERLGPRV